MPVDTATFRRRLRDELVKISETMARAKAASITVELDQSSVGRVSRMDAMQQQAMAQGIGERLRVRQRQIEGALSRIANGRFGHCCACDAVVEPARLNADPATVCCLECAEARESSR